MDKFLKTSQEILNLINKSKTIIIQRHINPDGDALGSQLGLKAIIEDNFKDKKVLAVGEMNERMLELFGECDEVDEKDYEQALVIVCDTANRERISGQLWNLAKYVVKIDHHIVVDNYGKYNLVDEQAVAACQVVCKWAEVNNLKISQKAARHLFLGLVTDSGRFLYPTVTSETFQIASGLLEKGIKISEIYQSLYLQTFKVARIKGYILSNFTVYNQKIAYIIFDDKRINKLRKLLNKSSNKINQQEAVSLLAEQITGHVNLMSNIEGIKIWFIATQESCAQTFKVSIRSSEVAINEVAAMFGGGGHKFAAGAKLKNKSEVEELLLEMNKLV